MPGRTPIENGMLTRRENPHKYLLYKPSLSQLFVFLASGIVLVPLYMPSMSQLFVLLASSTVLAPLCKPSLANFIIFFSSGIVLSTLYKLLFSLALIILLKFKSDDKFLLFCFRI